MSKGLNRCLFLKTIWKKRVERIRGSLRRRLFDETFLSLSPSSSLDSSSTPLHLVSDQDISFGSVFEAGVARSEKLWGTRRYWSAENLILGSDDGLVGLLKAQDEEGRIARDETLKSLIEIEGLRFLTIEKSVAGYTAIVTSMKNTIVQIQYFDGNDSYIIQRYSDAHKNEAVKRRIEKLEAERPRHSSEALTDGSITDIGVIVYNLPQLKLSIRYKPKEPRNYTKGVIRDFGSKQSATEAIRGLITEQSFPIHNGVFGFYFHYAEVKGGYSGPDAQEVNTAIRNTYRDVIYDRIKSVLDTIEMRTSPSVHYHASEHRVAK